MADQVRQRVIDASYSASTLLDGVEGGALEALAQHTSSGVAGKWILLGWLCVALALGGGMAWRNARFRARVQRDRVRALEGDEQTMLESLCRRYRVKPVPVYFVDRLPSRVPDRGGAPLHCRSAGYFAGAPVAGAGA